MSDTSIDRLSIEIEANADAATRALDELDAALSKLANNKSWQRIQQQQAKMKSIFNKSSAGKMSNVIKEKFSAKEATASTKGLAASLGGLAVKAGAALFSIRAIQRGITDSLSAFSDYQETVSKYNVAMGEFAEVGAEFADRAEIDLGANKGDVMNYMATIQSMTTGFSMASDKAYILSKNISQLALDFASFHNLQPDVAFQKLRAAISGETEPLKALGKDVSNARLQQELYNLGISASVSNLGQADKAMLRYIAIMHQSGNEMGDLARTLDSPANMMRMLSSQAQILARTVGSLLMPVLKAVLPPIIAIVQLINDALGKLAAFLHLEIKAANTDFGGVASGLDGVSSGLDNAGSSAGKAAKEMRTLLGGFDELNVLSEQSSTAGGAGGGGSILGGIDIPQYDMFAGLADSLTGNIKQKIKELGADIAAFWKEFISHFQPSIDAWAAAWEQIKAKAVEVWPSIKQSINSFWNDTLVPLGSYLLFDFAPSIANAFSEAFAPIAGDLISAGLQIFANTLEDVAALSADLTNNIIIPSLDTVKTIWSDMMLGIKTAWEVYGKPIADALVLAWDNVSGTVQNVYYTIIEPIWLRIIEAVNNVWNTSLKPLWDNVMLMIDQIALTALDFWNNVLSPWVNYLIDTFGPGFVAVFDTVATAVETAINFVGDMINTAVVFFNGLLTFLDTLFVGGWDAAWDTVGGSLEDFWDAASKTVKDAVNGIIKFVNSMLTGITNGINSVIDKFNSLSVTIPDWVPEIGGNHFGVNIPKLTAPQIPELANGGVLYNPQLVLAGEYANARSNPEIIAPQTVMRDTFEDSFNNASAEAVVILVQAINAVERAIENNDKEVVITDHEIGRAAQRWGRRQEMVTGKNPFID